MVVCIENPKEFIKKFLKLISYLNDINRMQRQHTKGIFLYASNQESKNEVRKAISFTKGSTE